MTENSEIWWFVPKGSILEVEKLPPRYKLMHDDNNHVEVMKEG